MPELDPIKIEVIRHGLAAAADEMALALQRAAYSTNIKTRQDFSCAIFDRQARIISQSFSQPVHLGSLTHFVPRILEEYGIDELQPGDGILCNDGHRGGVHLNDVCLVTPVFYEGELVAFVAAIAHHLDVGGGTPGSIGLSRDMYAEGLRIAPIRIMVGGKIDERVLRFITANVRAPRETAGDLRAQVAGVTVGSRRLLELIERNSWPVMNAAVEELLDYTERRVRAAISRLPEGSYHATGWMDSDGITDQPVRIQLRVDIGQNKVRFDLTGSDEQRPCPINATYAMSLSNCAYALRVLLDDDVPINAGFYRALELVAPPGTIVNAQIPAAVGGGWEMGFRVCETALQALASAAPERMAAGSKGCLCNIAFGGVSRREGERYVFYETMGGGYGARATKDGIDAVQPHGQNTENSPIEETEAGYPVRILRYEMVPDSEGAGRFRGGLGLRRDYLFEAPATFSVVADRARFQPWGLFGGDDAPPARYVLDPYGEARSMPAKFSCEMRPGDMVRVQMAGGGGYGPAVERDPALVLADVRNGKVSVERAKSAYGVVITADGELDLEATEAARQALRNA
jgi:N-methylhydantoinase B